jgi:hypothetical protein
LVQLAACAAVATVFAVASLATATATAPAMTATRQMTRANLEDCESADNTAHMTLRTLISPLTRARAAV